MNRNEIFHILHRNGLKTKRIQMERGYHIRMYFKGNTGEIDLGCMYVRGFDEIALCTNEIVIISKFGDMKVNVK